MAKPLSGGTDWKAGVHSLHLLGIAGQTAIFQCSLCRLKVYLQYVTLDRDKILSYYSVKIERQEIVQKFTVFRLTDHVLHTQLFSQSLLSKRKPAHDVHQKIFYGRKLDFASLDLWITIVLKYDFPGETVVINDVES